MRVKVNQNYNDTLYDFFEIRNIGMGYRSGNYYEASHLLGRFSYDVWLDKPLVLQGKYGQANTGYDAYYLAIPNVKTETVIYSPDNCPWKFFATGEFGATYIALKRTMENHYGIPCEILYRQDAGEGTTIKPYGIRTQTGKYFAWILEVGKQDTMMCYYGDIFFHIDRPMYASILATGEYAHYRVNNMGREGIDDYIFGHIDNDIIGLDEIIPSIDKQEFMNNFITEISGIFG